MKILVSMLLGLSLPALAAEAEFGLVIRDHRFEPAELRVPAGRKVRLVVQNLDATAEEFESHDLNREKMIAPGAKVGIFVGPLAPGRYSFFGEFNERTARGVVIAE